MNRRLATQLIVKPPYLIIYANGIIAEIFDNTIFIPIFAKRIGMRRIIFVLLILSDVTDISG